MKPGENPFPLFPHWNGRVGRWAKKIRGKLNYFGTWTEGPQAALDRYNAQKDDLHAGRKPREESGDGATVKELANRYFNAKKSLLDNGELSPRTFIDIEATTDLVVDHFGKTRLVADARPDDFATLRTKLAKRYSPVPLGNWIQRVRSVFKYAYDNGLIAAPIRFGSDFQRPSKKAIRLAKAAKGKQMFQADEIGRMVDKAGVPLKAMLLLGINCGFGNADCGTLPLPAVDLDRAWIDYPRPKTGVARRCPLWPETVQALRDVLAKRPTPKTEENADLVFVTKYGQSWAKDTTSQPISAETRKLLNELGINGRRGFYCLRHTFQTIGDEAKDPVAVRFIMGHADDSMSANYREDVSDQRLQAVVAHVRAWLWPPKKSGATKKGSR